MKSSDLDGRICGSCEKLIRPGTVKTGGGYHFHGDHVVFESQCPPAAGGVQYSRAAAAVAPRVARSRRSKTRRSTPHGGGRPRSFIAALVVEHAAKLFAEQRRWSYVLEALRSSGNGTYARNTLIRRVSEYSSIQYSDLQELGRPGGRRRRRPSKTSRRKVASR